MVIIWSARAKRDFDSLVAYTHKHSPRGAKRIAARIQKRIDDLADMPHQGSLLPKNLRRLEITETPYLLIFRVEANSVQLVRILHGRRNRWS
jgi:toxin ParE1/3/4